MLNNALSSEGFVKSNAVGVSTSWIPTITLEINFSTYIIKIFGKIVHDSATAPTWGETVATIPKIEGLNFVNPVSLNAYSERGVIYNCFALYEEDEWYAIKTFSPDYSKLTNKGENIYIQSNL